MKKTLSTQTIVIAIAIIVVIVGLIFFKGSGTKNSVSDIEEMRRNTTIGSPAGNSAQPGMPVRK